MRKRKFYIGGLIVFIAIAYLVYSGFSSSATYYFTVSEVFEQQDTIIGKNIRVNGQVVAESVQTDPAEFILKFDIVDSSESLAVLYKGVVPDTFRDDSEVVVEGHLNEAGEFEANAILTKCPSKYVPE